MRNRRRASPSGTQLLAQKASGHGPARPGVGRGQRQWRRPADITEIKEEMKDKPIRVLLIEDNPGDAQLIKELLAEAGGDAFDLLCVDRLSMGLDHLADRGIDLVLLDLSLPDASGLDTFSTVRAYAPHVPVIVLTGLNDETLAVKAVQEGAQDHLAKGKVDGDTLVRSVRYAIERQRMLMKLRAASLVDDLTGLHNRRGFLTLARWQLKLAARTKRSLTLLFIDLDDMKRINDTHGHPQGDQALLDVANILKKTFRESDVVARIAGDEFAVLAADAHVASAGTLVARIERNLKDHNDTAGRDYHLSISIGTTSYDPEQPCSIEELLARADAMMYQQKRNKQLDGRTRKPASTA